VQAALQDSETQLQVQAGQVKIPKISTSHLLHHPGPLHLHLRFASILHLQVRVSSNRRREWIPTGSPRLHQRRGPLGSLHHHRCSEPQRPSRDGTQCYRLLGRATYHPLRSAQSSGVVHTAHAPGHRSGPAMAIAHDQPRRRHTGPAMRAPSWPRAFPYRRHYVRNCPHAIPTRSGKTGCLVGTGGVSDALSLTNSSAQGCKQ
jgi:hypothetical protein